MAIDQDLAAEVLAEVLPGRPVRSYPALLSTEADALAWARAGGPPGALVVAGYQASPRGRAGLPWVTTQGRGLGFSLVLRPRLPPDREGWIYTAAASGLADALGEDVVIAWPDEARRRGVRVGAVGASVELGPDGVVWAVVSVLVPEAAPPRAPLLAQVIQAVEARLQAPPATVLGNYLPRCQTIGRRVRARLIPLGPAGLQVEGRAVDALADGALVIETTTGRQMAVRPQHLGLLDELDSG